MAHSLVQTLRTIPDFSTLDERTLLTIVGESSILFWKTASSIFERGAPGEALYVILTGAVLITDEYGRDVARLQSGDSFGEISLLLNTTHRRNAVATTDCEMLVLAKEAFSKLLDSNPDLAEHFAQVLNTRHPAVTEAAGG